MVINVMVIKGQQVCCPIIEVPPFCVGWGEGVKPLSLTLSVYPLIDLGPAHMHILNNK